MTDGDHELVLTPPATRAIRSSLPEGVAAAVIEFLTGALAENPQRVGRLLRGDLAGIVAARRGTYRVLYRINEIEREVVVLRIDHRRDARARWPAATESVGRSSGLPQRRPTAVRQTPEGPQRAQHGLGWGSRIVWRPVWHAEMTTVYSTVAFR